MCRSKGNCRGKAGEPMKDIRLSKLLELDGNSQPVISIVGGGGKTTALFTLASEFREKGRRVLVTTTTAMFKPEKEPMDQLMIQEGPLLPGLQPDLFENPSLTVWGTSLRDDGKLTGVSMGALLDTIAHGSFDISLIESDGSRRRPVKAPASHEPVIAQVSTTVIGVIGLSCLQMKAVEENVHRLKRFCDITGARIGEALEPEALINLVLHQEGLFKTVPQGAQKILMLNQADHDWQREAGHRICQAVKEKGTKVDVCLLTSFDPAGYSLEWGEKV